MQQTDGQTDLTVPSISILTHISLFSKGSSFCCFNLKQMHGLSLTKRKGTEEAFLKFISLPSHRGFYQLAGQDRETDRDFTERWKGSIPLCGVMVCWLPAHREVIVWSQWGELRGFPFIKVSTLSTLSKMRNGHCCPGSFTWSQI